MRHIDDSSAVRCYAWKCELRVIHTSGMCSCRMFIRATKVPTIMRGCHWSSNILILMI